MPDKATIEALAAMFYKCCQEVAKEEIKKHAEEEAHKSQPKDWMTVDEYCSYTGLSRQSVYNGKANHTIPIVKVTDGSYMINVRKIREDAEQNGRKNTGKGLRVIN